MANKIVKINSDFHGAFESIYRLFKEGYIANDLIVGIDEAKNEINAVNNVTFKLASKDSSGEDDIVIKMENDGAAWFSNIRTVE